MIAQIDNARSKQSWNRVQFNNYPSAEEAALLALVTMRDDEVFILGNAFVIACFSNSAICFGAAHSFDEAKKIQRRETAQPHPTFPNVLFANETSYIKSDGIWAIQFRQGKAIVCTITELIYIENYDVAAFVVHSPERQNIFNTKIAIDLRMPKADDEVAILANMLTAETLSPGQSEVEQQVQMLLGVVTSSQINGDRMQQKFSFETNIPASAGMSGAPVLRRPEEGATVVACGVVSSDFSPEEAFTNTKLAGLSTAAMIWPAVGFGIKGKVGDDDPKIMLLTELIDRGIIDNRSSQISVSVTDDDLRNILYVDTGTADPTRYWLRTVIDPRTREAWELRDPPK